MDHARYFLCVLMMVSCQCVNGLRTYQMSIEVEEKKDHVKDGANRSFAFAKHFNNHMVLQRAPSRAIIYGFAPNVGHKLIVQMVANSRPYYYRTYVTKSPDDIGGVWSVQLDQMEANVTATILVVSEIGTLSISDIIFGDVWICSGQSNMQFTLSQMFGGLEEIAEAHTYPNIRLMTVGEYQSNHPLLDLVSVEKVWSKPSFDSLGGTPFTYFSAVCWLYGKSIHKATGVPIGLLDSNWGGTPVEAWSSPDSLNKCGMAGRSLSTNKNPDSSWYNIDHAVDPNPQNDSVLWNAMIYPLLQMPIYGAIWYQGEQDSLDVVRMNHYNCTFPTMIADWRDKFNAASKGGTSNMFPFGFVQLSAWDPSPSEYIGFPNIRWHQTADYGYVPNAKMPNVFMSVAMDLPDFSSPYYRSSIHPRDKIDVANRLSLGGLSLAYNMTHMYQGPLPTAGHEKPTGFILDYGTTWQLEIRNLSGFEFYCSGSQNGGLWVPTSILEWTNTTVSIFAGVCFDGKQATKLRYAWQESPCLFKRCAIYSVENYLPAPPFVVDLTHDTHGQLVTIFGNAVWL